MKKRAIKKTNRGEEKKTNFTELDKGKKNEKLETVS